jgi:hypothetical protein
MISDETRAKEIVKKLRKCNFEQEQEQEFILKGVYDSDPLMKNLVMEWIKDREFINDIKRSGEALELMKTANRRALIAIAVSVTSSIIALLSFLN